MWRVLRRCRSRESGNPYSRVWWLWVPATGSPRRSRRGVPRAGTTLYPDQSVGFGLTSDAGTLDTNTRCISLRRGANFRPFRLPSFIGLVEVAFMSKQPVRATDGSRPGLNDDIGEETRLELYRMQVEIREAEQRAFDLFLQNLVKGTSHLSLGQEAVAAGFAAAMKPGDLSLLHLSRPCPHARARRAGREGAGRTDAARQRPDARQGRLDAPDLGRARRDGLLRHHRRASADRLRRGLARAVQGRQATSRSASSATAPPISAPSTRR